MSNYSAMYEKQFVCNLERYVSLRRNIGRKVERILADPYINTEILADAGGKLNLLGCRIIFVICEECRSIPECEYCLCEGLPDKTVVFLTVGPP